LSAISINTYLRTIRSAFNRWVSEGFLEVTPFDRVKVPKAPKKVIPTFSQEQLEALLSAINISTPEGFRDRLLILLYLDTAARLGEITNLKISDVNPMEKCLKIFGKGQKERIVPIGVTTQKMLWKYLNFYRPDPALPRYEHVFLTRDGRPLTGKRVEAIMKKYGEKAGISGVRCSPHTLRHTACVMWLRNGGDIFSLQRITGHSSLEVLRGYVNLAQGDIAAAHQRYSAVDNLELRTTRKHQRAK
jgi:site-specific recombinase XerD